MAEFCDPDEFLVIHGKTPEDYKQFTLREMLPEGGFPAANKATLPNPRLKKSPLNKSSAADAGSFSADPSVWKA